MNVLYGIEYDSVHKGDVILEKGTMFGRKVLSVQRMRSTDGRLMIALTLEGSASLYAQANVTIDVGRLS